MKVMTCNERWVGRVDWMERGKITAVTTKEEFTLLSIMLGTIRVVQSCSLDLQRLR